jgi:translocation and assembly module TamA
MDGPRPPRAQLRPRRCAVLAILLGGTPGCVHLKGTQDQPAILSFRIEGLKQLDEGALRSRLATQESERSPPIPIIGPLVHQVEGARERLAALKSAPRVPIVGPAVYALRSRRQGRMVSLLDPDQLEVDRQRVEAYCRDHGYYDARVVDTQVVPVGEGQVAVTIRVEEGEPIRVTRIAIDGLDAAPEAGSSIVKPALRQGDVFTVGAYDAFQEQIATALHDHGWATGEVEQQAQVIPEEHAAIARYTVVAGPRFRFGPILVAGTGLVSHERVRLEASDEIRIGDWYDESKLARAQSRVFGLGVFGGVRVSRGTPDEERGIVPVLVAVREAPFRSVRLGPSLGVLSSSRVDVSGLVGWTHRNFLGGLRKLDLSLTVGYAWLLAGTRAEGLVGTAAADLTQARALGRSIDLGAHLEVQRSLEQGYDYWAQRVRLSLPVHLSRRVTFVPSYNLEVYELSSVASGDTSSNPLLQSCPNTICLLSYLEQRIEWDGRDDPLNTRRGFYTALAVQEGGHVGGFGYQYLRFLPEVRAYLPVGERSVLAARARIGAFMPVGESSKPPSVALFQAGGPNSMRGYGQGRLSPMICTMANDPVTGQPTCTGEWVPTGGNGMAEYSLELRFPVHGALFGAVFTDAAIVSEPSAAPDAYRAALDPSHLQWAAGVGIRYRTPIGPVRFDVAARLPDDLSRGVELDHRFPTVPPSPQVPDPGPHREPIIAFHLTVGEAF